MPAESKAELKKRTAKILRILKNRYPDARTALNWSTPLELLVATILSAQCTDRRVNLVTRELFREYRSAADYADVPQEVLEGQIRSTGFFRNKAKNIRNAAARIVQAFGGAVPDNMADLLSLAGVARKTANVVLGDAFNKREGIVVDTHVTRLAGRLRLTRHVNNQADRIERDLMQLVVRRDWTVFAHVLIYLGREICTARKPDCAGCPVSRLCPSALKV